MDSMKHLDYYQCRACYNSTNNLQLLTNLAECNSSQDAEKTYIQLLLEVCNINILDDKPLGQWPQFICSDCSQKLKLAHDFIKQTHKINQLLKSIANLLVTKSEIEFIENPELDITLDIKVEKDEIEEALTSEREFQYSPDETDALKEEPTFLPSGRWENFTRNNCFIKENNYTIEHVNENMKEFKPNTAEVLNNYITIKEDVDDVHSDYINNDDSSNSNSEPTLDCTECNESFTSTTEFNRHKRFNHASKENKLSCPICIYKCSRLYNLQRHLRTVHKSKKVIKIPRTKTKTKPSETFTCNKCKKIYNSRKNLRRHERFVHIPDEMKIICKFCGSKFARKEHIKRHMELVHDGGDDQNPNVLVKVKQMRFFCDKCDRSYTRRCRLSKHQKEVHGQ